MSGLPGCDRRHSSDCLRHLHCLHNSDHAVWARGHWWQRRHLHCSDRLLACYSAILHTLHVRTQLSSALCCRLQTAPYQRDCWLLCVSLAVLWRYKPSEPCGAPTTLLYALNNSTLRIESGLLRCDTASCRWFDTTWCLNLQGQSVRIFILLLDPEDGGNTYCRNVGPSLPVT